jgi:hypothetical protein
MNTYFISQLAIRTYEPFIGDLLDFTDSVDHSPFLKCDALPFVLFNYAHSEVTFCVHILSKALLDLTRLNERRVIS